MSYRFRDLEGNSTRPNPKQSSGNSTLTANDILKEMDKQAKEINDAEKIGGKMTPISTPAPSKLMEQITSLKDSIDTITDLLTIVADDVTIVKSNTEKFEKVQSNFENIEYYYVDNKVIVHHIDTNTFIEGTNMYHRCTIDDVVRHIRFNDEEVAGHCTECEFEPKYVADFIDQYNNIINNMLGHMFETIHMYEIEIDDEDEDEDDVMNRPRVHFEEKPVFNIPKKSQQEDNSTEAKSNVEILNMVDDVEDDESSDDYEDEDDDEDYDLEEDIKEGTNPQDYPLDEYEDVEDNNPDELEADDNDEEARKALNHVLKAIGVQQEEPQPARRLETAVDINSLPTMDELENGTEISSLSDYVRKVENRITDETADEILRNARSARRNRSIQLEYISSKKDEM